MSRAVSVSPQAVSGSGAVSVLGQGSPGWHQPSLHGSAPQTLPVPILSCSRAGPAEVAAGTGSRSRGSCTQGGGRAGGAAGTVGIFKGLFFPGFIYFFFS